jgi:hypothetical protein
MNKKKGNLEFKDREKEYFKERISAKRKIIIEK